MITVANVRMDLKEKTAAQVRSKTLLDHSQTISYHWNSIWDRWILPAVSVKYLRPLSSLDQNIFIRSPPPLLA